MEQGFHSADYNYLWISLLKNRKFDDKPSTFYPYDYMLVWMSKHLELPAWHVLYENIPWPMLYSKTLVFHTFYLWIWSQFMHNLWQFYLGIDRKIVIIYQNGKCFWLSNLRCNNVPESFIKVLGIRISCYVYVMHVWFRWTRHVFILLFQFVTLKIIHDSVKKNYFNDNK